MLLIPLLQCHPFLIIFRIGLTTFSMCQIYYLLNYWFCFWSSFLSSFFLEDASSISWKDVTHNGKLKLHYFWKLEIYITQLLYQLSILPILLLHSVFSFNIIKLTWLWLNMPFQHLFLDTGNRDIQSGTGDECWDHTVANWMVQSKSTKIFAEWPSLCYNFGVWGTILGDLTYCYTEIISIRCWTSSWWVRNARQNVLSESEFTIFN